MMYRIKPLAWVEAGFGQHRPDGSWIASLPFDAQFAIFPRGGGGFTLIRTTPGVIHKDESHPTVDTAKAAAQEYYQEFLLTVLEPAVPLPLDDALKVILGRVCFRCGHLAQAMRERLGLEIETRAEAEQAAVIHFTLNLYLLHGEKWLDEAVRLTAPPKEEVPPP